MNLMVFYIDVNMTEIQLITIFLPKIIVATICGLIIGLEREMKHKVAGVRTHILICVGACLYTAIGIVLADTYNTDPMRVVAQIITGVGFLGAGVIFKSDDKIVGVTSAAFIWFISSIGVLVGIGYLFSSVLFTIGLLVVLVVIQEIENKLKK